MRTQSSAIRRIHASQALIVEELHLKRLITGRRDLQFSVIQKLLRDQPRVHTQKPKPCRRT